MKIYQPLISSIQAICPVSSQLLTNQNVANRARTRGITQETELTQDFGFQAIQISQIMTLECEVLKGRISERNRASAIELIAALQGHAISIGKMMREKREKSAKL
jgi:hypothetical protein